MTLVRWLALPTGYVNVAVMVLASISGQPLAFYGGWFGATMAFYGWLLVREEDACPARGTR